MEKGRGHEGRAAQEKRAIEESDNQERHRQIWSTLDRIIANSKKDKKDMEEEIGKVEE